MANRTKFLVLDTKRNKLLWDEVDSSDINLVVTGLYPQEEGFVLTFGPPEYLAIYDQLRQEQQLKLKEFKQKDAKE